MDGGVVNGGYRDPNDNNLPQAPTPSAAQVAMPALQEAARTAAANAGADGATSGPEVRPSTSKSMQNDAATAARKKFVTEMEQKRSQAQLNAQKTEDLVGTAMADGDIEKASGLQKEVLGYVEEAQNLTIKIKIDPDSSTIEEQEDVYADLIRVNRNKAEDFKAKSDLVAMQIEAKTKEFSKDDSVVVKLKKDKKIYDLTSDLFLKISNVQQESYKTIANSYKKSKL